MHKVRNDKLSATMLNQHLNSKNIKDKMYATGPVTFANKNGKMRQEKFGFASIGIP
jgi:hypothetical protein